MLKYQSQFQHIYQTRSDMRKIEYQLKVQTQKKNHLTQFGFSNESETLN